jgi:hypothetical protein
MIIIKFISIALFMNHKQVPYSNFLYNTSIVLLDYRARRIGLCVSGQKMNDLLQKLRLEHYPVREKIVLLIGTNDILQVGCIYGRFHKLVLLIGSDILQAACTESSSYKIVLPTGTDILQAGCAQMSFHNVVLCTETIDIHEMGHAETSFHKIVLPNKQKQTLWPLVRKRTIPSDHHLSTKFSAKFCG